MLERLKDKDGKKIGLHRMASIPTLFAHPASAEHILHFLKHTQVARRPADAYHEERQDLRYDHAGWEVEE